MAPNRRFSLALDSLSELNLQATPAPSQPTQSASALSDVLAKLGPLPREGLFLGIASDGLPVLLNLYDPHPGPMLILGETRSGKTAFLQSIARSVVLTHKENEVQFGVITKHTEEWKEPPGSPQQVGVFDVTQPSAQDFLLSLASWAHSNKNSQQSTLLLIDDLEAIARLDFDALQNFRWLLLRGPARRVWPLITMSAERYGQVLSWIEIFRTRVFGRIEDARLAEALGGDKVSALDQLEAGKQFSLRENGNWLRFNLPSF
ncbi:MAG TPA: FtsK/SpoIIIE domain-containing protein [Anaerolineales bacterium]|nr:FtsK/SpoIIIE domain-containing protein [Anaerolineales bacterium]